MIARGCSCNPNPQPIESLQSLYRLIVSGRNSCMYGTNRSNRMSPKPCPLAYQLKLHIFTFLEIDRPKQAERPFPNRMTLADQ
jgi:hypothetical protein